MLGRDRRGSLDEDELRNVVEPAAVATSSGGPGNAFRADQLALAGAGGGGSGPGDRYVQGGEAAEGVGTAALALLGGPIGEVVGAGVHLGEGIFNGLFNQDGASPSSLGELAGMTGFIYDTLGAKDATGTILDEMAHDGRTSDPDASWLEQEAGQLSQTIGQLGLLADHGLRELFGVEDTSMLTQQAAPDQYDDSGFLGALWENAIGPVNDAYGVTAPVEDEQLIGDDSAGLSDDITNRVTAEREVNPDGTLGDIERYTVDGNTIDIGDWAGSDAEGLDDSERLMLALVANKMDGVTAEVFKDNPEMAEYFSSDNAMVYEPDSGESTKLPMMAFDVSDMDPEAVQALMEQFGGTSEDNPNGDAYNMLSEGMGQTFNGSMLGGPDDLGTDEGYQALYRMAITEKLNEETGEVEKILGFYAEQVPEWSPDGLNLGGSRNGPRPGLDTKLGSDVPLAVRVADEIQHQHMQDNPDATPFGFLDDIQDNGLWPTLEDAAAPLVEAARESTGPLYEPVGDLLNGSDGSDGSDGSVGGMSKEHEPAEKSGGKKLDKADERDD